MSHISIDRTGGRRRKGSSINCTIDDVRTTNVCWYVRLVLFRVHFYLGCATTDLYTKRYRKSCYSRRRRRASSSSKTKIWLTSSLPTVLTKHSSFPFGEMQTHSERIASSSVVRIGGVKYSVWPFLSPFANVRAIRFLLVAKQINEPSGDHEKAELTSSFSFKEESCSIVPVVELTKCN